MNSFANPASNSLHCHRISTRAIAAGHRNHEIAAFPPAARSPQSAAKVRPRVAGHPRGGNMPSNLEETDLAGLLRDPLTAVLMARDGISHDAMMSLLIWVAAQRADAAPVSPLARGGQRGEELRRA